MKTINFHHILTNISNLFRQFINTPPDLICRIFHYIMLDILYLTYTAMLPFIMGLIFFTCLSFDIFHLAVFFCHINICIVKQTYTNFSACSLHTCDVKLIISLWGLCVHRHALISKYHVSLFLSPFLFIDYL